MGRQVSDAPHPLTIRYFRAYFVSRLLATIAISAQATSATPARWVADVRAADDAALDSAISKLESFLNEYPASNVRPNALLQLGELLVRDRKL